MRGGLARPLPLHCGNPRINGFLLFLPDPQKPDFDGVGAKRRHETHRGSPRFLVGKQEVLLLGRQIQRCGGAWVMRGPAAATWGAFGLCSVAALRSKDQGYPPVSNTAVTPEHR